METRFGDTSGRARALTTSASPAVPMLAAGLVLSHLATAGRYGIFRDELYYIACARHLAWGYVDHPPLIALITWLVSHTLGMSLLALRLLPALAAGALVLVTADLARALGGRPFAQALAALAVAAAPIYLLLQHWLTMNAWEPLIWAGMAWCALRAIDHRDGRYWLLFGAIAGVGLENKYSVAVWGFGLLIGLVMTPERRWLGRLWFWAAGLLAGLIFLPNLLWLWHHDFPFIGFENASRMSGSRIVRGPIAFLTDQALIMNPVLAPLWLAGAIWLLRPGATSAHRALGVMFVTTLAVFILVAGKNYYVASAYPLVFAAGAVAFERLTTTRPRWLRQGYLGCVALSALVLAPLVMPILPVRDFVTYSRALGGFTPVTFENLAPEMLPQYFADEFGWENMARQTAIAYLRLPPDVRGRTAIFANDYGQAAAIDFFGPALGLPSAISNDVTYWLWGPRGYTGESVIVLGSDGKGDRAHFGHVEMAGRVQDARSRPEEWFNIYMCREFRMAPDLPTAWRGMRRW